MSMTLDQAREAVRVTVAAVTALSDVPVYDYLRHITTEMEIKELATDGNRLHFWCVAPAPQNPATILRLLGTGACDQAKPFQMDIHGFYALQDLVASEKAFLTIAWSVFEALRADKHPTGSIQAGPPQWLENDHRMYSGVLCHHVRFSFPITAQLSP